MKIEKIPTIEQQIKHLDELVSSKQPFDVQNYNIRKRDIDTISACRSEWGYSLCISPDVIMTEKEVLEFGAEIRKRFNRF